MTCSSSRRRTSCGSRRRGSGTRPLRKGSGHRCWAPATCDGGDGRRLRRCHDVDMRALTGHRRVTPRRIGALERLPQAVAEQVVRRIVELIDINEIVRQVDVNAIVQRVQRRRRASSPAWTPTNRGPRRHRSHRRSHRRQRDRGRIDIDAIVAKADIGQRSSRSPPPGCWASSSGSCAARSSRSTTCSTP